MNLNEMFEMPPEDYQDIEDDNSTVRLDDLRKSRLTLMQLNKLRRMQDMRAYEKQEELEQIQRQYSQSGGSPEPSLEI